MMSIFVVVVFVKFRIDSCCLSGSGHVYTLSCIVVARDTRGRDSVGLLSRVRARRRYHWTANGAPCECARVKRNIRSCTRVRALTGRDTRIRSAVRRDRASCSSPFVPGAFRRYRTRFNTSWQGPPTANSVYNTRANMYICIYASHLFNTRAHTYDNIYIYIYVIMVVEKKGPRPIMMCPATKTNNHRSVCTYIHISS